jgi:hypothetical protein
MVKKAAHLRRPRNREGGEWEWERIRGPNIFLKVISL